jgi:threonine/homoserine/homoserine lactone efflux protein
MELASWITIGAVCLTGAASPGPSLAVVVKNTVAGGRGQGIRTGVGHGLGVGIYAFGAVAGVAALIETVPGMDRAIELLGGLYLLWLGVSAMGSSGSGGDGEPQGGGKSGFAEGFTIAFLNPKIAVFFLALLGSFLPAGATTLERAGVAGLALVIDTGWYVFAAVALVRTGAAGWLRAHGQWLDRVLGLLLIAIGAWLVLQPWLLGLLALETMSSLWMGIQ